MAIFWDDELKRWVVTQVDLDHREIVGVATPPPELGTALRSITDPNFRLSPGQLVDAIRHGDNYQTVFLCKRRRHTRARSVRVGEVRRGKFLIYVVWGTAKEVAELFDIRFKISKSLVNRVCPYVLGWTFIGERINPTDIANQNPIVRLF